MRSQQTDAIVLRTLDYSEADIIVSFLGRDSGRIDGIAKHGKKSRKRFAHAFEPGSLVFLAYRQKKDLAWLESCRLIDAHLQLRSDMVRWSLAAVVLEIVADMTPPGEGKEALFDLLRSTLARFTVDNDPYNVSILFMARFMALMGYLPDLDRCQACGAELMSGRHWWWVLAEGRVLCSKHPQPGQRCLQLDLGTLVLLNQARGLPLEKVWRLRITRRYRKGLHEVFMAWVMATTRKELKTLRVLRQFENAQRPCSPQPAAIP